MRGFGRGGGADRQNVGRQTDGQKGIDRWTEGSGEREKGRRGERRETMRREKAWGGREERE